MGKKYLKFILPSTLSFLLTGIYSIVDGIFVGRAMGDDGLAAINIAWPLVALIIALGTGIGMGASVMVSLNLGAGNEKAADKMEGNAFLLLFVSSLLLTAFLYLAGSPLLTLLGAEGVIHGHALTYLSYMLLGGVIQVLASGSIPLMRCRGAAFYSMCSMGCGCLINIALDYYLVLLAGLELFGAAMATVCGQSVTLALCLAFYLRKKNRIPFRNMKPDGKAVSSILRVAVSPFGLTYLPSVTIIFMNLQCLKYGGEEAVSACRARLPGVIYGTSGAGHQRWKPAASEPFQGKRRYEISKKLYPLDFFPGHFSRGSERCACLSSSQAYSRILRHLRRGGPADPALSPGFRPGHGNVRPDQTCYLLFLCHKAAAALQLSCIRGSASDPGGNLPPAAAAWP